MKCASISSPAKRERNTQRSGAYKSIGARFCKLQFPDLPGGILTEANPTCTPFDCAPRCNSRKNRPLANARDSKATNSIWDWGLNWRLRCVSCSKAPVTWADVVFACGLHFERIRYAIQPLVRCTSTLAIWEKLGKAGGVLGLSPMGLPLRVN